MIAFAVIHNSRNTRVGCCGVCPAEALAVAFSLVDNLEAVVAVAKESPLIGILNETHCVGILCLVRTVAVLNGARHIPSAAHCHVVPVCSSEVGRNLEGTSPCCGELNGRLKVSNGDIYIIISVERALEFSRQSSDLCTYLYRLRLGGIEGIVSLVLYDVSHRVGRMEISVQFCQCICRVEVINCYHVVQVARVGSAVIVDDISQRSVTVRVEIFICCIEVPQEVGCCLERHHHGVFCAEASGSQVECHAGIVLDELVLVDAEDVVVVFVFEKSELAVRLCIGYCVVQGC